jgi:hypothetical protein
MPYGIVQQHHLSGGTAALHRGASAMPISNATEVATTLPDSDGAVIRRGRPAAMSVHHG